MEFHGVSMEHPVNSVEFAGGFIGYPLSVHKEFHAGSTESPWRFHENFMEFHGGSMETPLSFIEDPWNLHGVAWSLHGTCLELCGVSWRSMEPTWNSVKFHGVSIKNLERVPNRFHGISIEFHGGVMVVSMEFHGAPSMELCGISGTFY